MSEANRASFFAPRHRYLELGDVSCNGHLRASVLRRDGDSRRRRRAQDHYLRAHAATTENPHHPGADDAPRGVAGGCCAKSPCSRACSRLTNGPGCSAGYSTSRPARGADLAPALFHRTGAGRSSRWLQWFINYAGYGMVIGLLGSVGAPLSGGPRALYLQSLGPSDAGAAHGHRALGAGHEIPGAHRHRCAQGVFPSA